MNVRIAKDIRLVIVEDDPVQAQVLQDKLLEFNDRYNVLWYKNGEDMMAELGKIHFRNKQIYIILDYFLQTNENSEALNGFEIIKVMGEKFPKVRIILFSSYENDDTTDFKRIKEEPNVIDFIKKSNFAFASLQNTIRFHYSQTTLAIKKRRFQWALSFFILLMVLSALHFVFSFISH